MSGIIYRSTRGSDRKVSASQAILSGIAEDGGLYVPEYIPHIDKELYELKDYDYIELTHYILGKYLTDFNDVELRECIQEAYSGKFDNEEVVKLTEAGNSYFLELYHGPTLAFKDVALSLLPHILKKAAVHEHCNKKILILTATSGDTGSAALEGFSNVDGTQIIVFYPEHGISNIQRKQMITHAGNNISVFGIEGNFDDAQREVKKAFNDEKIRHILSENNIMVSSANSINIGRLIPQIVYYFFAYLKLLNDDKIGIQDKINFVVPTGNFGNILAGYYAKRMGLPIGRLICASNENKVLSDFFKTGNYDIRRKFYVTNSPSMDILISSNLERLLFEICERDPEVVNELMKELTQNEGYTINSNMMEALKDFYGGYATQEDTAMAIKEVFENFGIIIDTHTAVAYSVYKDYLKDNDDSNKTVILATASPFKFPRAVMNAINEDYCNFDDETLIKKMSQILNTDIPHQLKDIWNRKPVHNKNCKISEVGQCIIKCF